MVRKHAPRKTCNLPNWYAVCGKRLESIDGLESPNWYTESALESIDGLELVAISYRVDSSASASRLRLVYLVGLGDLLASCNAL